MPLTEKGRKIMRNMKEEYGEEKGEEVFYASKNKGTITGVDKSRDHSGRKNIGEHRSHKGKGRGKWGWKEP